LTREESKKKVQLRSVCVLTSSVPDLILCCGTVGVTA
jgi:hypothetical protein